MSGTSNGLCCSLSTARGGDLCFQRCKSGEQQLCPNMYYSVLRPVGCARVGMGKMRGPWHITVILLSLSGRLHGRFRHRAKMIRSEGGLQQLELLGEKKSPNCVPPLLTYSVTFSLSPVLPHDLFLATPTQLCQSLACDSDGIRRGGPWARVMG
jgi:hypothetical protein